jgi:hypothetical protein
MREGLGVQLTEQIFGRVLRFWKIGLGSMAPEELSAVLISGAVLLRTLEDQPMLVKIMATIGLLSFLLDTLPTAQPDAAPDIDGLLRDIFGGKA